MITSKGDNMIECKVVGTTFAKAQVCVENGTQAQIIPEPDNPKDPNALGVWVKDNVGNIHRIGYVPKYKPTVHKNNMQKEICDLKGKFTATISNIFMRCLSPVSNSLLTTKQVRNAEHIEIGGITTGSYLVAATLSVVPLHEKLLRMSGDCRSRINAGEDISNLPDPVIGDANRGYMYFRQVSTPYGRVYKTSDRDGLSYVSVTTALSNFVPEFNDIIKRWLIEGHIRGDFNNYNEYETWLNAKADKGTEMHNILSDVFMRNDRSRIEELPPAAQQFVNEVYNEGRNYITDAVLATSTNDCRIAGSYDLFDVDNDVLYEFKSGSMPNIKHILQAGTYAAMLSASQATIVYFGGKKPRYITVSSRSSCLRILTNYINAARVLLEIPSAGSYDDGIKVLFNM